MDKEERIAELKEKLSILTSSDDYDKREAGYIKKAITSLEKYGTLNVSQNKDIKNKVANTMMEKYSRKNGRGFGSKYSYKTMVEKYGSKGSYGSEELRSKIENTMKERYNVDNPTKNSSIRAKSRNTCRIRYGVDNPSKSPIIKRKKQETRRKHK